MLSFKRTVMIKYREFENASFAKIFRIYINGASSAGKTYFAKMLLESNLFDYKVIHYYHPDFHEHAPVDWHETMCKEVFYQAGIPTLSELLEIPENSCLVFDDLFSQCCESKDIDYLFRVLSSKRKLNVIIMTQRYFAEGKCRLGLSIRNSCNYHVLMNNADARTNLTVANAMQLKAEITRAIEENKTKLYPYIFLDRTNQARVNNLQVYTNIFGKYKQVICGSMKYYLLSESDFKANFRILGNNSAKKRNANTKSNKKERYGYNTNYESQTPANTSESSSESSSKSSSESSPESDSSVSDTPDNPRRKSYYRRSLEQAVKRTIRKRKGNT